MHFGEPFILLIGLGYGLGRFIGEMAGIPYFAFLASTSEWLIKNNTNKQDASKYIAEMFKSLSILGASIEPADFDSLAKKHQTAGGLNEQAVRELYQDDWYIAIDKTLDRILSRLEGKYVYSPKDS